MAALHSIVGEIARTVGGGAVTVVDLVQPGVDPHEYEPSPADMRAVVDADLILASGLGLESYLGRLVAATGTRARIVEIGDHAQLIDQDGEYAALWRRQTRKRA